jgi:Lon protease-like protein
MNRFPLPILPLPEMVLFPHTVIPMLIVEPTYIKMVKDCLMTDQSLGVALAEPMEKDNLKATKYSPQRIATMGKPVLLEEHDDGSLKILIRGESRIELIKVEQNIPYLIYQVRELPDIKDGNEFHFDAPKIERLKDILFQWIDDTVENSIERESFIQSLESLHHIIDYLSMFLVHDRSMRQLLLENCSLHQRVQILSTLLRGNYPDCEDELVLSALKEFEYGPSSDSYGKVMH